MKKKLAACLLCVVLAGGIYGLKYLYDLKTYKDIVSSISVSDVDLSKVKDGDYTGSFNAIFVSAETRVTVKNGKIVDIKLLKHKTERGKSAESITQKVISEQSLSVDTVSGATNSSKVILKSIENALQN